MSTYHLTLLTPNLLHTVTSSNHHITLSSSSTCYDCSAPIFKVQLTVESKLAVTMRFLNSEEKGSDTEAEAGMSKVTCDVDMSLQDERWYHVSVAVHPRDPMAVFINGVQIKYYCMENVSAPTHSVTTHL